MAWASRSTSEIRPRWTPRWSAPSPSSAPSASWSTTLAASSTRPLLETTENGWDALYRSNLKHVILCTQRVARVMVEHQLKGSIMSVTSIEGVRAAPGYAAYAAAKAGVINYTKTAALELAAYGIRVNALAPDITWTEGLAAIAPTPPASRSGSA